MAKDIIMRRTSECLLAPIDQVGLEYIQSLPVGREVGVTVVQARNYEFHKKIMALLTYLFDVLPKSSVRYKGRLVEQTFNVFRGEMVAISGHYTESATMSGTLRIEPQSLSYSQCSEELARTIYSDVIDKSLKLLGNDQSREDLEEIVENILRFD